MAKQSSNKSAVPQRRALLLAEALLWAVGSISAGGRKSPQGPIFWVLMLMRFGNSHEPQRGCNQHDRDRLH
jgi:hypothetical protein